MARRKQKSGLSLGVKIGIALGVGGVVMLIAGSASAAPVKKKLPSGGEVPLPSPDPKFDPDDWANVKPLPTAEQVTGSVTQNWGITPSALRPLLLLAEQVSGIRGSARVLSIIARRESRWVTTAHRTVAWDVQASTNAYLSNKDDRPPLKYGLKAAGFGSAGLFQALAPYYLWTGINTLGAKSPLLDADPETAFFPRCATFAAICYMQRLLTIYDIRDIPDIKVGWASVSLLSKSNRGGVKYNEVRARFAEDVQESGISLSDPTIPSIEVMKADAKAKWPGVMPMFEALVGTVPVRKG